jgi:glutamate decarboxylase
MTKWTGRRTAGPEHHVQVDPRVAPGGDGLVPLLSIPDGQLSADAAYQLVHDEAMLDGNSRLNLATFVGTWMEPQALKIYTETVDKNMIDKDEYPQTAAIEERCVRIVADLWNSPEAETTAGTSTIGSSEACMLAGMAFKRRWQAARRAEGKSTEAPNMIMSAGVQVVWEKFCNYWEVQPRYVPVADGNLLLSAESMLPYVDENTIGVVAILGSTFTGDYEPVAEIAAALDQLAADGGPDVPLHVDAASGGFVAPFLQPDLVWDFRLPRVHSISTSGHKYGLVYPGVGWVVWRTADLLPEDLVFHVSYLGGDMPTFGLNFSRPGAQVLLQYYTFVRYGREGFRKVQQAAQDSAVFLSSAIGAMPQFELLSDGTDLPVFAWELAPSVTNWDLHDLSRALRERGWLVPAYPLPPDCEDRTIMRVVVRAGFSPDLARLLLTAVEQSVAWLDSLESPLPRPDDHPPTYHH